jgi:hypothetical protein
MSIFTMSNYINIALFVGLIVMAVFQARSKVVSVQGDVYRRLCCKSMLTLLLNRRKQKRIHRERSHCPHQNFLKSYFRRTLTGSLQNR